MDNRNRVTASAKLVYGQHDDLIEWWLSVPLGKRQTVIINALRTYINLPPDQQRDTLSQVRQDVAWIRQAIERLPGALAASVGTVERVVQAPPINDPTKQPRLTPEEMHETEERMLRNRWRPR